MKTRNRKRLGKSVVALLLVSMTFFSQLTIVQPVYAFYDVLFDGVMLGVSTIQCAQAIVNDSELKAIDCGGAVVDLGALLIPGVPAVGGAVARLGTKSVTKADDVYQIAMAISNQVDNIDDYIDGMKNVGIIIPRTTEEMKAGKMIFDNYDDAFIFVTGRNYKTGEITYNLQRHHLNPQIASSAFGLSKNRSMTVVLGQEVHAAAFNTQLNEVIKKAYGVKKNTDKFVLNAQNAILYLQGLDKVYNNYPLMKAVAMSEFIMSKGGQNLRNMMAFSSVGLTSFLSHNLDPQEFVKKYNSVCLPGSKIDLHDWSSLESIQTVTVTADPISRAEKSIIEVTSMFANKSIKLKSVNTGQYVCEDNISTVHADGKCGVSNNGIYQTTLTADGWIGFQIKKDGKWLSVQNLDYLRTEGDKLRLWECFKVYKKGNDYYLLSAKNKKFVQVQMNEPAMPLKAARPYSDGLEGATWERFRIEIINP